MTRNILIMFLLLFISSCADKDNGLEKIDISELTSSAIVGLDDRYDKWFERYNAVFLEGTDKSDLHNANKLIIGHNGKVIILIDGRVHSFDVATGKAVKYFLPETDTRYTHLDMDVKNDILYALDSINARIDCISQSGTITDSIHLEAGYIYDKIVFLEEDFLLVTTYNFPCKVTFLADFGKKSVTALDIPETLPEIPDEEERNKVRAIKLPLYIVTKTADGDVLIKYLFDDIMYKYGKSGATPVYEVVSDGSVSYRRDRLIVKGKKNTFLHGMWQLGENLWLVRYYRPHITNYPYGFAILKHDMSLYNSNPLSGYNSSLIEWKSPVLNVYDIHSYNIIHIQPEESRIYKLISHKKNIRLPLNLRDYPSKNELLLCTYDLK